MCNVVAVALSLALVATCVAGDLAATRLPWGLLRALADNLTHGAVAGLSWLIVCAKNFDFKSWAWLEALACGAAACLVDVDHFVAAGSLSLKVRLT